MGAVGTQQSDLGLGSRREIGFNAPSKGSARVLLALQGPLESGDGKLQW